MSLRNIDFSTLEKNVAEAAEELYSACLGACPNEKFCGFAFIPDEDVQTFNWTAGTVGWLDHWTTEIHKEASKHGGDYSLADIRTIMQFACDEWAYSEETLDLPVDFDCDLGLDKIWTAFRDLNLSGNEYDDAFRVVRRQALEAIARGLSSFRQTLDLDGDFVALVRVNDSTDMDEMLSLARMSNAPEICDKLERLSQDH